MATMWRRAMTYLGLGPDEEYEDYEDLEPAREAAGERSNRSTARTAAPPRRAPEPEPEQSDVAFVGSVRRIEAQPLDPTPGIGAMTTSGPQKRAPVVRAIPNSMSVKPHVVSPGSFNDAQEVADKYKGNVPVIMNLQDVDRDLSRRLIDFASGLCYGVGGTMEKVAHQVYLLTPSNVEVSPEERRRLQERGLYD